MLKLEDVHTFYGLIEAVKGIDIEVRRGEIVCLIGSNGAGKSTTLMTLSGILRPRTGNIYFEGANIRDLSPHRIVGMGISQVPEGRRIFPRLTILENLEMGAYSARSPRLRGLSLFTDACLSGRQGAKLRSRIGVRDRLRIGTVPGARKGNERLKTRLERVFDLFPILKERQRQLGGTLSGGEQQMLAIGRALMSYPKMLLLDEPSLGLAPIIASKIFKVIKEINREGVTILLVEQNAHAALSLSDRGYVLENGRVAIHGAGEELLRNERVKKAYLGE